MENISDITRLVYSLAPSFLDKKYTNIELSKCRIMLIKWWPPGQSPNISMPSMWLHQVTGCQLPSMVVDRAHEKL
jgi:hypothetical protein